MTYTKNDRNDEFLLARIEDVLTTHHFKVEDQSVVHEMCSDILKALFSPEVVWAVRQKLGIAVKQDPEWERTEDPEGKVSHLYNTITHSYYIHRPSSLGLPKIFRKTLIGDEWERPTQG